MTCLRSWGWSEKAMKKRKWKKTRLFCLLSLSVMFFLPGLHHVFKPTCPSSPHSSKTYCSGQTPGTLVTQKLLRMIVWSWFALFQIRSLSPQVFILLNLITASFISLWIWRLTNVLELPGLESLEFICSSFQ